jgi:leucyl aminopeptidase (aminopeptidase T)
MTARKVGLTVAVALIIVPFVTMSTNAEQNTSKDAVAQKLVNECTRVQENELVMITGSVRDLELLEDMATHVSKVGAFPLVVLNSERLDSRYFDEVPAKFDRQEPKFYLKLAEMVTSIINVGYGENPGLLADVPPERFEALNTAYAPVGNLLMKRNVKQVQLGNNLYPTESRAKRFHMTREQLEEVFWAGINTDYSALQKRGEELKARLVAGKKLHLTNINGTDLEMEIAGRKVFVTDGVISDEDVKEGGRHASCGCRQARSISHRHQERRTARSSLTGCFSKARRSRISSSVSRRESSRP